jgi:DNA polymerase
MSSTSPIRAVILDVETRSRIDLRKAGAWRYAADPSTDAWCAAYAIDDDPVELWIRGESVPAAILECGADPDTVFVAHNAAFERAVLKLILTPRYGWPDISAPEKWRDTMSVALALALPAKLAKVAQVLGLEHQKADDTIMHLMAKPRRPRKDEDPAGLYWFDDPERLQRLYVYCRGDVGCERDLHRWLPPLSPAEQELWRLDQCINDRGFYSDGSLIEKAIGIAEAAERAVQDEIKKITGGVIETTHQVARILAYLAGRGCELKDLQKGTLSQALRRKDLGDEERRILELRREAAHASATKMEALKAWRGVDGRVRGAFRYHGAATGRWSGSGPQPQNFRKEGEDTAAKVIAVMSGDLESVRRLGPPIEVVGDVARASICAPPGSRLIIGDFSGIESRVLAWIADEPSKLELWAKFDRTGALEDDPYFVIGRSLGFPEAQARKSGKTADLAFGYQGGLGAYRNFAPEGDTAGDAEIEGFKQGWRSRHPQIEQFWYGIDRAAIVAVNRTPEVNRYGRLRLQLKHCNGSSFLIIELPSGRRLAYPFPKIITNRFARPAVEFMDNSLINGGWGPGNFGAGAYGGLWTENIVSGIARDLLAAAMQRLEAAGYPVALHIHDEIVCELEDGVGSVEEFKALIVELPAWAEGLPVAAKVRNGPRFAEADLPVTHVAGSMEPPPVKLKSKPAAAAPIDPDPDSRAAGSPPREPEDPPWQEPKRPNLEDPDPEELDPGEPEPGAGSDKPRRNGWGDYPRGERRTGQQVAFYIYRDARGRFYLGVKRTSTKQFPQYHWSGRQWRKGLPKGFLKIPYRLPELLDAPPGDWVVIAAGEKDAETAARLGFTATTNSGGEGPGQWTPELNRWFSGFKRVAIMEDNDEAGYAHAAEVAKALEGIVPNIRIVGFRELKAGGDLSDWIEQDRGRGYAELLARIEAAPGSQSLWPRLDMAGWDDNPPRQREWLVADCIPVNQPTLCSGQGAAGKSILMLQLSVATALGKDWLGLPPRQGPVVYLGAEDEEDELHRRLDDIREYYKGSFAALDKGLHVMCFAGVDMTLAVPDRKTGTMQPTPLFKLLIDKVRQIRPRLVVIDTSADVFGGNEIDRAQVRQFISMLRQVAIAGNSALVLVSHPSLTGIATATGISGSTAWHNGVRARCYLKPPKKEEVAEDGTAQSSSDLRELEFKKNNYGKVQKSITLRWQAGVFITTDANLEKGARDSEVEEVFLKLMAEFIEQKRPVSPSKYARGDYAPKAFAKYPGGNRFSEADYIRAMDRLLQRKAIRIETWGPPSKRREYLVPGPG